MTQASVKPGTEFTSCPFCGGEAEWASRRPYLAHCADPDCLGHHYEQDEQSGYNHAFYTEAEAIAAWNTRSACNAYPDLIGALEAVMIGGNHIALLIGASHPPYTASPDEALAFYGAGDTFEIWCCWRSIMQARDTVEKARQS